MTRAAAFKPLLTLIQHVQSCNAQQPDVLRRQLASVAPFLERVVVPVRDCLRDTDIRICAADLQRQAMQEGKSSWARLLMVLLRLLHRLLVPAASSPPLHSWLVTQADLAPLLRSLLRVVTLLWGAVARGAAAGTTGGGRAAACAAATDALQKALDEVAAASPCAMLTAALLLPPGQGGALLAVVTEAASASVSLLSVVCKVHWATAPEELCSARLLACTCASLTTALGQSLDTADIKNVQVLSAEYIRLDSMAAKAAVAAAAGSAEPGAGEAPAPPLLWQRFCHTPEFEHMLLAYVRHINRTVPAVLAGQDVDVQVHMAFYAAQRWVRSPHAAHHTSPPSSSRPTAEHLQDVVQASRRHCPSPSAQAASAAVVVGLWPRFSGAEQARAFVPAAGFAQHMLRTGLEVVAAPTPSLPLSAPGAAACQASTSQPMIENSDALRAALPALHLLASCLEPPGAAGPASADDVAVARRRRVSRALWMLRSGVLGTCEALLRSAAPQVGASCEAVTVHVFLFATAMAALLLGSPHAPAATAGLYSLAAPCRKAFNLPSPASQGVNPSGSGAVAGSGDSRRSTTLCALLSLLRCALLSSAFAAGFPAAVQTQQVCMVQLLPAAVHAALRHARATPGEWHSEDCLQLVQRIAALNDLGLSDLTAAAAAPALLRRLFLCASRCSTADAAAHPAPPGSLLVASSAAALAAAGGGGGWQGEARRLDLPGSAAACSHWLNALDWEALHKALVPLVPRLLSNPVLAAAAAVAGPGNEEAWLRPALSDFGARMAPQATLVEAVVPSWDGFLLAAAGGTCVVPEAHPDAGLAAPFFGCWHRGCTALAGPSATALQLRKCTACKLARYCSEACQRRGWRAGHRAACQPRTAAAAADSAAAAVRARQAEQSAAAASQRPASAEA